MPGPNTTVVYNFTYGFIRGMQATTQFQGACQTNFDLVLTDVAILVKVLPTAYLPADWFNLLDTFRTILVDYSSLQQQCQIYNILGSFKQMMSLNGIMALFSRLLPQSFVF